MREFQIMVNERDVKILAQHLGQGRYCDVAPLINKMQAQIDAQCADDAALEAEAHYAGIIKG